MADVLVGGRYQSDKLLASHDAVKTWRGKDTTTGAAVIIKVLDVGRAGSTQEVELFERQGNVLSQLKHPRIPAVLGVLQEDVEGRPSLVLVTQFVDGDNLENRIKAGMSLDERGIIGLGIEMARVLEFLHGRLPPVVHRDVKPSNLVQTRDGALHLVDFGSVKLPSTQGSSSRGATVVGTYGYMPPEQFEGRATPASDVHALGMTLLYLATHKHPWEHGDGGPRAAISSSLGMSPGLRTVLRKMTEPDPQGRYPDGLQARLALEGLLNPKRRAGPWMAVAGGLVLLLGGGGGVMMLTSQKHPTVVPPQVTYVPDPPIHVVTPPRPPRPPPAPPPVPEPMFFSSSLGQAHRCFTRAVPRVIQSRGRYLSWLTDGKQPTCKERYISYGLYEGYEDAIEICAASSESAPESLQKLVGEVAEVIRVAIPLLKTADRYYDEERYKDDDCKGARNMHGPLMDAFNSMLVNGKKLEVRLLEEDLVALREAARRHEGHPLMASAVGVLRAYHRVATLSPSWGEPIQDSAMLLEAVREAVDRADALEAQKAGLKGTLSSGENSAVDSLVSHSAFYRTLARQLREGKNQRSNPLGDPLETREKFFDAVVDIHLWAEPHR